MSGFVTLRTLPPLGESGEPPPDLIRGRFADGGRFGCAVPPLSRAYRRRDVSPASREKGLEPFPRLRGKAASRAERAAPMGATAVGVVP